MEMRIMIEELETEAEFKTCYPFRRVQCYSGKVAWVICKQESCYRCMILQKAIVNFEITEEKGHTIEAIGRWTKTREWQNASSIGKI
eukprot:1336361-Heterocapsa_arctica.AAC.1